MCHHIAYIMWSKWKYLLLLFLFLVINVSRLISLITCHGPRTVSRRLCTRSRSEAGNLRPGSPAQSSDLAPPGTSAACDWSGQVTWHWWGPRIGHSSHLCDISGACCLSSTLSPASLLCTLPTSEVTRQKYRPLSLTRTPVSTRLRSFIRTFVRKTLVHIQLDTFALGSSCPFLYQDIVLVSGEGVEYLITNTFIEKYSHYAFRPATEICHASSGDGLIPWLCGDNGNNRITLTREKRQTNQEWV